MSSYWERESRVQDCCRLPTEVRGFSSASSSISFPQTSSTFSPLVKTHKPSSGPRQLQISFDKDFVKILLRMIESQKFVMTNLRNGIDYLKNTCKDVGRNNHFCNDILFDIFNHWKRRNIITKNGFFN